MTPQFDLIVFGATSFVGQILCNYLIECDDEAAGVRWAIAGRSSEKLENLKRSLGLKAADLPVIVADAADPGALETMCQQTRVVVSTVGPYALYGEPLVKACAENGTDYCDLTGEAQWIEKMISKYAGTAEASGARIVHCCGFDSIPSDLGVYFLQEQAQEKFGENCDRVKMRVKALKGGFSGGTVASIVNAVKDTMADPAVRKSMANPYSICPKNHPFTTRQLNQKSAILDEDFGSWTAPFVMAAINTRVVFRSNALLDARYGTAFQYDEAMLTGKGLKGRFAATTVSATMGAFIAGTVLKPSRWVLENYVLPKPGEGPSPAEQESGMYDLRFFGKTPTGKTVSAKVTGDRDPGYGSTAKMLSQAAICLAKDIDKASAKGGFWTPSTIFGDKLIRRLTAYAGLTFETVER